MGFETLSCAIVRVILHYHAYQTKTPLINTDDDAPLESMLDCTTDEIDTTLKRKITEATTGSNSSRLTLLQYMHFGLSLSEKARNTENPEEIQTTKVQLIQFIQNIQQLFSTTNIFATRTLLIPTDKEHSLSIYRLDSPTARAYKLTQTFLSTLELSLESTKSTVQETVDELFLNKENQSLLKENIGLKASIKVLNQKINLIEEIIDQTTTSKPISKTTKPKFNTFEPSSKADEPDETKDWEIISPMQLEHHRLMTQNQILTQRHEEKQEHYSILQNLLTTLQEKPTRNLFSASEKSFSFSRRKEISSQSNIVTQQPTGIDASITIKNRAVLAYPSSFFPASDKCSLMHLLTTSLNLNDRFSDSSSSGSDTDTDLVKNNAFNYP